MRKIVYLFCLLATVLTVFGITPQESQFFESKIRPVLVNECFKCHSKTADKIKGGLLLDTKNDLLKGGENGPIIIPKQPSQSVLIKAIRHESADLEMPPKKKLPDSVIKDFETWISMGAPDPREGVSKASSPFAEMFKKHWAYQPIKSNSIPDVKDSWIKTDLDKIILQVIKSNGLYPSPTADKYTLIRRLYYDLLGLPPSVEKVKAFINDSSPNAYEKLVDELLASPQYGERWGRYWLDVARYADTSGTIQNNRENRYTYSYTYRDYVIDAFNADKPYTDFILEQIAADKVNGGKTNLAALGFLTLGRNANNNINDIIDDRIDVVGKGFLGSTIVCARCHDHKFDPITTADYYALHGIFNSSFTPEDKPLIRNVDTNSDGYKSYLTKKKSLEKEVETFIDTRYYAAMKDFKTNTAKALYGSYVFNTLPQNERSDYIRENKVNPRLATRWTSASQNKVTMGRKAGGKGTKVSAPSVGKEIHPVYYVYGKMFSVPSDRFVAEYNKLITQHIELINSFMLKHLKALPVKSMQDVANAYQRAVLEADLYPKSTQAGLEEFRATIFGNRGPLDVDRDNFPNVYANNQMTMRYNNELLSVRGKLITHELTDKFTPPRAMVLLDKPSAVNSPIFFKGDPGSRGAIVPRRFLENFAPTNNLYSEDSGRLKLAQDIIKQPLTQRVIINRIWQHLLDEGFIGGPDDFGINVEKPIFIDAMDFLCNYFVQNGWSIKKVQKLILTSNVYMQQSTPSAAKAAKDADNRLLWRAHLKKMDFETLRDSMLSLGEGLDLTMGGPSVELLPNNLSKYSSRRSIYGHIDRARLPDIFTTFDFATPDMPTGKRFDTIVPKQALFLMNGSFTMNQVKSISQKTLKKNLDKKDTVNELYHLFFQREPTEIETSLGVDYLSVTMAGKMTALERYVHTLLLSNEMVFIY